MIASRGNRTAVGAPQRLNASAGIQRVSLSWGAPGGRPTIAGYWVYRNGVEVAHPTTTSYTDTGLTDGDTYSYYVVAHTASGNASGPSNSVSAAPLDTTPPSTPSGPTASATSTPSATQPLPPANGPTGGFTGVCTATISPPTNLATAEQAMSPGQTLCLNSGTYGTDSTLNVYYQGGTAGDPITITSAPGATATIDGNQRIEAPYITEEYLNIDNSNNLATTPQKTGCTNVPYSVALEVDGDGDVLQYDNIYESIASLRANLIGIGFQEESDGVDYGHPAGVAIRYDKLSDAGGCSQQDHIVYDAQGSGTQIYDNWMWNDPHGWGVQIYPNASNGQIYSNVIDGAIGGFIDGSGGGNSTYDNVVENSVVEPDDVSGSQYMDVCFGLTAGAASPDTVSGNASYNNANGTGSSCSGITFSSNITLASDPFVSSSTHNYNLVSGTPVANYGLWNGAGPPTPDPAP